MIATFFLFSWKSCENPFNCTFTDEVEDEEEKFLLPFGATSMDTQQPKEDELLDNV